MTPRQLTNFWAKVDKTGTCWNWTGYRENGYGRVMYDNRPRLAHRVAWLINHGVWPTGELLHKCDNPGCVRLDHLIDGTHEENMADMRSKGRAAPICQPSFTAEEVIALRERFHAGESMQDIAKSIGRPFLLVRRMLVGQTYRRISLESP